MAQSGKNNKTERKYMNSPTQTRFISAYYSQVLCKVLGQNSEQKVSPCKKRSMADSPLNSKITCNQGEGIKNRFFTELVLDMQLRFSSENNI